MDVNQLVAQLVIIVTLAFANGAIAITVTKSKFFANMRAWFSIQPSRAGQFVYDLLSCPYCFSHWLAVPSVIIWKPKLTSVQYAVSYLWIADYIVSAFMLVAASSLVAGCIFRLFKDV